MEAEAHSYLFTDIVLSRQLWSAYYMSNMVLQTGDGKASKILSSKYINIIVCIKY